MLRNLINKIDLGANLSNLSGTCSKKDVKFCKTIDFMMHFATNFVILAQKLNDLYNEEF